MIDLAWKPIPDTDLYELVIERCGEFATGLRIVFFHADDMNPSVWVLGGMNSSEEFDENRKIIYVGRSIIVKERATERG